MIATWHSFHIFGAIPWSVCKLIHHCLANFWSKFWAFHERLSSKGRIKLLDKIENLIHVAIGPITRKEGILYFLSRNFGDLTHARNDHRWPLLLWFVGGRASHRCIEKELGDEGGVDDFLFLHRWQLLSLLPLSKGEEFEIGLGHHLFVFRYGVGKVDRNIYNILWRWGGGNPSPIYK